MRVLFSTMGRLSSGAGNIAMAELRLRPLVNRLDEAVEPSVSTLWLELIEGQPTASIFPEPGKTRSASLSAL